MTHTMHRFRPMRRVALVVATGVMAATVAAGGEPVRSTRTMSASVDIQSSSDITERDDSLRLAPAGDEPRILDPDAELEATSIDFQFKYHFGADLVYDARVVAQITNVDTAWSGWSRTWEIYSFPSNNYVSGIYLVDAGMVPPLAPGETYEVVSSLPSSVDLAATYVLMLSPGDADASNDIAVSLP